MYKKSTMSTNYYNVLEISKSATTEDIRKAYRKLALKWHPDKNPTQQDLASTRFKEISEAYEILSDKEKKRAYDQNCDLHEFNTSSTQIYRPFPSAPTFTFRDPILVFREFFESVESHGEPIGPLELLSGLQMLESLSQNTPKCLNDMNDKRISSIYSKSDPRRDCRCPNCFAETQRKNSHLPSLEVDRNRIGNNSISSNSQLEKLSGLGQSTEYSSKYINPGYLPSSVKQEQNTQSICKNFTSLKFVNGKKVKTITTYENDLEVVKVYENNILKSHLINGEQQLN